VTAQIPDTVTFNGQRFAVAAVEGIGLFDPARVGIHPEVLSTACWRGFICDYEVVDAMLVLRHLEVGIGDDPPEIRSVSPSRTELGAWQYDGLNLTLDFTGRVLIGNGDPSDRPYLHMGFLPAWFFAEVWDLTFDAGRLVGALDRSADVSKVRARLGPAGARPRAGQPTSEWIDETFSLAYSYSLPDLSRVPRAES
jgi:hypothetical protein